MITNNYYRWIGAFQRYANTNSNALNVGLIDTSGTNINMFFSYSSAYTSQSIGMDGHVDLQVGNGTGEFAKTDYTLANNITSNFGTPTVSFSSSVANNKLTRTITWTAENTSGSDQTIRQVGVIKKIHATNTAATNDVLIAEFALENPVTVGAGETATVTVNWIDECTESTITDNYYKWIGGVGKYAATTGGAVDIGITAIDGNSLSVYFNAGNSSAAYNCSLNGNYGFQFGGGDGTLSPSDYTLANQLENISVIDTLFFDYGTSDGKVKRTFSIAISNVDTVEKTIKQIGITKKLSASTSVSKDVLMAEFNLTEPITLKARERATITVDWTDS